MASIRASRPSFKLMQDMYIMHVIINNSSTFLCRHKVVNEYMQVEINNLEQLKAKHEIRPLIVIGNAVNLEPLGLGLALFDQLEITTIISAEVLVILDISDVVSISIA